MLGKTQWTHGCKFKCCSYPQHKSSSKRKEERHWRDEWLGVSDPGYDAWVANHYFECDDDFPTPEDFFKALGSGCFFEEEPLRQTLMQTLYGNYQLVRILDMRERQSLQEGNIFWLDLEEVDSLDLAY